MKTTILLMFSLLLITISASGQPYSSKNLLTYIDQDSTFSKPNIERKSLSKRTFSSRKRDIITRQNKRITSRSIQRKSIDYPRKTENKSNHLIAKTNRDYSQFSKHNLTNPAD